MLYQKWKNFIIESFVKTSYTYNEVLILIFREIFRRMLCMCPDAWYIFIRSIQLTAFILICAFVLMLESQGNLFEKHELYMIAVTLYETGQAILLIGAVFSVCIEDIQSSKA